MVAAVRTPLHHGGSLALANRRYRKEIIVKGPLHVNGDVFDVTDEYLDHVMAAYEAGAIKSVPIKAAPSSNDHTRDVFRRCGTVVGLHRTARGIDADLEPDEKLNELIERYPDTGVSVLIEHNRTTGGGDHFPAALAHLLVTEDPVINNLDDWALAASHEHNGEVLDLLALSTAGVAKVSADEFSEAEIDAALAVLDDDAVVRDTEVLTIENPKGAVRLRPMPTKTTSPSSDEGANPDPSEGTESMPSIKELLDNASEDELRDLRTKLDTLSPTENAVTDDDEVEITDAEIDEALALVDLEPGEDDDESTETESDDESETEDEDAPEAIAASHAVDSQLALANAQMAEQLNEQGLKLSQMQARVNDSDWADRKTFYAQASVPGYLVDRAKPFLHGNDTSLKLSQSDKQQAAKLVDSLLLEFGGTLQRLGLAQGVVGTTEDTGEAEAAEEARRTGVASALAAHGAVPARRATKPRP